MAAVSFLIIVKNVKISFKCFLLVNAFFQEQGRIASLV
jgi:hypothetical protein